MAALLVEPQVEHLQMRQGLEGANISAGITATRTTIGSRNQKRRLGRSEHVVRDVERSQRPAQIDDRRREGGEPIPRQVQMSQIGQGCESWQVP